MRNLCVRDRMATDAPLVAMEREAIAAGNAAGLGNALVLDTDVTSRVVIILTKVRPLKKSILSSAEPENGARPWCQKFAKSSVANGSPK